MYVCVAMNMKQDGRSSHSLPSINPKTTMSGPSSSSSRSSSIFSSTSAGSSARRKQYMYFEQQKGENNVTARSLSTLPEEMPVRSNIKKSSTLANDVVSIRQSKTSSRGSSSTRSSPSLGCRSSSSASRIRHDDTLSLKEKSHRYVHSNHRKHKAQRDFQKAATNRHKSEQRGIPDGGDIDEMTAGVDTFVVSLGHAVAMDIIGHDDELDEQRPEFNLATDSDKALRGSYIDPLPGDDETILATGNSSNSTLALQMTCSEQSTSKSAATVKDTRKVIREAEIQDNIEFIDDEIKTMTQKLHKLQESRRALVNELNAAASQNLSEKGIPEEVSYDPNRGSRRNFAISICSDKSSKGSSGDSS